MTKIISYIIIAGFLLSSCVSDKYKSERGERQAIAKGNVEYNGKNYTEAGTHYDEAIIYNPHGMTGKFNKALSQLRFALALTDSTRQKGLELAYGQFEELASSVTIPNISSQAYYNMGNIMFADKKIPESIELYKNALRINPADSLARRNLRIAQLNQSPKDKNNQNQNDNKNKDKDKDNKQQQPKPQSQQQPQQQRPQPQQPQQFKQGSSDRILQRSQSKENEVRKQLYKRAADKDINRRHRIKNW